MSNKKPNIKKTPTTKPNLPVGGKKVVDPKAQTSRVKSVTKNPIEPK